MSAEGVVTAVLVVVIVWIVVVAAFYVWYAIALSRLFPRFGVEGWRGWVPFLNESEILRLGGFARWYVVLLVIPFVSVFGVVVRAIAAHRIGQALGRGAGATVLAVLLPPVWATLLAWGEDPRVAASAPPLTAPMWTDPTAPPAAVAPAAPAAAASGAQLSEPPQLWSGGPLAEPAVPVPAPAPAAVPAPAPGAVPAPAPAAAAAPAVPAPAAAALPPEPVPAPVAPPTAPQLITLPPEIAPPPLAEAPPEPPAPPAPPVIAPVVPAPTAPVIPPAPAVTGPIQVHDPWAGPVSAFAPPSAAAPAPAASAPVAEDDDDVDGETVVVDRRPAPQWELALDDGPSYPLHAGSIVMGRRPAGSDPAVQYLAVQDGTRTLSKSHARLDLVDGAWSISDLYSTNGVLVLDDDGAEHAVEPGSALPLEGRRFLLGRVTMRLRPLGDGATG